MKHQDEPHEKPLNGQIRFTEKKGAHGRIIYIEERWSEKRGKWMKNRGGIRTKNKTSFKRDELK